MAPNSLANRHANMELAKHHAAGAVSAVTSVVKHDDTKPVKRSNHAEVEAHWPNGSKFHASIPKISEVTTSLQLHEDDDGDLTDEHEDSPEKTVQPSPARAPFSQESIDARKALGTIYEKVLVVDNVESARSVVQLLTSKYKNFIHACDTEVGRHFCFIVLYGVHGKYGGGHTVPIDLEQHELDKYPLSFYILDPVVWYWAIRIYVVFCLNSGEPIVMQVSNIDVKQETPVDHGEVICFSIYSGSSGAEADFGNGKTCIWVDVLDGGRDVLMEFAPFFEDPSIKKV
jgi:hypothetical protein